MTNKQVLPVMVICHSDPDGLASSAIVKQQHPEAAVLISNYGKRPPYHQLVADQLVYVVDMSFSEDDMDCMDKLYTLIWIDHHKTKIDEMDKVGFHPKGLRDPDIAACVLTWRYFYPDTTVPLAIQHIDDFDRWQFKIPKTLEFDFGLRCIDARPYDKNMDMWNGLIENKSSEVDTCINRGTEVVCYLDLAGEIGCRDLCFEIELEGKRVLAANTRGFSSLFFKSVVDEKKHDAVLLYAWIGNVGRFRYSIYQVTPTTDVSVIAKTFNGGGGHKGASGFNSVEQVITQVASDPPTEPTYEPFREELINYLSDNEAKPYAVKYAAQSDRVSLFSQWFDSMFEGYRCFVINHPTTEKTFFSPIMTTYTSEPLISYVWTNTGMYRIVIHNSNLTTGLNLQTLATKYQGKVLNGDINQPCHGSLWFYIKELPFKLRKRKR